MKVTIILLLSYMCLLLTGIYCSEPYVDSNKIDWHIKYDSLVEWDVDISNHIRQDFGIDTTKRTQYKQINNKIKCKENTLKEDSITVSQ